MRTTGLAPLLEPLSRLTALLALALLLARFVQLPWRWQSTLQLPGLTLTWEIGTAQILALLIALLCLGGVLALLEHHPVLAAQPRSRWGLLPHAVFPTITAWGLQVVLHRLPLSPLWWGVLASGLLVVVLVLLAEYIALDPGAATYATAATTLSGLGFLALLLLAYGLHAATWRLVYLVPALGAAIVLIALRTLYLRAPDRWRPVEAVLIAAAVVHLAAAWRYLPLSALSYALMVTGTAYAVTVFVSNLVLGESPREAASEPLLSLALFALVWLWSLL